MVFDLNSGEILLHKNEDSVRAIASLTKLVTAQVFLDSKTDLLKTETVMKADRDGAGRSRLRIGANVRLIDLFHLMLICSDNVAARIVSRSTGLDSAEFVDKMNRYAISLGLKHTRFADPTGLDANNVSTAAECSIIFKAALDKSLIAEVVAKKDYSFTPVNSKRACVVHNTNRLLYGRQDIIGGKTGFIFEAGYCLALGAETQSGRKLGAILLGAPSSGCRFRDAARLLASVDNIKQSGF
jgi:D-alanyl-D-alanine endopeptidase (penicillin-binding protein 7)